MQTFLSTFLFWEGTEGTEEMLEILIFWRYGDSKIQHRGSDSDFLKMWRFKDSTQRHRDTEKHRVFDTLGGKQRGQRK